MSMHPTKNYFKQFPNPYYVETGVWDGDSIELALQAGFTDIRGIELNKQKVEQSRYRFWRKPVSIFEGDSAEILWDVIKEIPGQITFWLDAHTQMFEDEPEVANPWPLLKELEQIARHPVKTHTIIIDDMLILTHPKTTGWTSGQIQAYILAINPGYKFEWLANPVKNNILVAHV